MTLSPRLRQPEVLWLLVLAALVCIAVAWGAWSLSNAHHQAVQELTSLEPRYARLAGLQQGGDLFSQDDAELAENMAQFVYPAEQDSAQLTNRVLQQVRELAAARELSVTSSQTSEPQGDEGFDRIGFYFTVEGDWAGIVGLLDDLSEQTPAVYYRQLQMSARGVTDGVARLLVVQLDLYILKERLS